MTGERFSGASPSPARAADAEAAAPSDKQHAAAPSSVFGGAFSWVGRAITDMVKKQLEAVFRIGFARIGIDGATFSDLFLRPDAEGLADGLPCELAGGFIGSIELHVPWRDLMSQPITVKIDRVYFVLRGFAQPETYEPEMAAKRAAAALRARVAAWQAVEDQRQAAGGGKKGEGLIDNIISSLAHRIEFVLTNVHVRLQEEQKDDPMPLALGFVLRRLAFINTLDDEVGTGGGAQRPRAKARVCKTLELQGLGIYLGSSADLASEREARQSPPCEGGRGRGGAGGAGIGRVVEEPALDIWDDEEYASALEANAALSYWRRLMQPLIDSPEGPAHILTPLDLKVVFDLGLAGLGLGDGTVAVSVHSNGLCMRHGQFVRLMAVFEALDLKERRNHYAEARRPSSVAASTAPREWWQFVGRCALLEVRRKGKLKLGWRNHRQRRERRAAYLEAYVAARGAKAGSEPVKHLEALEADGMLFEEIVAFRRLAASFQPAGFFKGLFGGGPTLTEAAHAAVVTHGELEKLQCELDEGTKRAAEEAGVAKAAAHAAMVASMAGKEAANTGELVVTFSMPSFQVKIHSERDDSAWLDFRVGEVSVRAAVLLGGAGSISLFARVMAIELTNLKAKSDELTNLKAKSDEYLRTIFSMGDGDEMRRRQRDGISMPADTKAAIELQVDTLSASGVALGVRLRVAGPRVLLDPHILPPLLHFATIRPSLDNSTRLKESALERALKARGAQLGDKVLDAIGPAMRAQLAAMQSKALATDIDVQVGTSQFALIEPSLTLEDFHAMRSALFPRLVNARAAEGRVHARADEDDREVEPSPLPDLSSATGAARAKGDGSATSGQRRLNKERRPNVQRARSVRRMLLVRVGPLSACTVHAESVGLPTDKPRLVLRVALEAARVGILPPTSLAAAWLHPSFDLDALPKPAGGAMPSEPSTSHPCGSSPPTSPPQGWLAEVTSVQIAVGVPLVEVPPEVPRVEVSVLVRAISLSVSDATVLELSGLFGNLSMLLLTINTLVASASKRAGRSGWVLSVVRRTRLNESGAGTGAQYGKEMIIEHGRSWAVLRDRGFTYATSTGESHELCLDDFANPEMGGNGRSLSFAMHASRLPRHLASCTVQVFVETRSDANKWAAACAAKQPPRRKRSALLAEQKLRTFFEKATKQAGGTVVRDAIEREQMAISFRLCKLTVTVVHAPPALLSSSAAEQPQLRTTVPLPLLCLRLHELRTRIHMRPLDLRLALRLQGLSIDLGPRNTTLVTPPPPASPSSARRDGAQGRRARWEATARPTAARGGARAGLIPLLDGGRLPADLEQLDASASAHLNAQLNEEAARVDATSLLVVQLDLVQAGSPAFDAAAAATCVDVALRPVRVHVDTSALARPLGGLSRFAAAIAPALAGMAEIRQISSRIVKSVATTQAPAPDRSLKGAIMSVMLANTLGKSFASERSALAPAAAPAAATATATAAAESSSPSNMAAGCDSLGTSRSSEPLSAHQRQSVNNVSSVNGSHQCSSEALSAHQRQSVSNVSSVSSSLGSVQSANALDEFTDVHEGSEASSSPRAESAARVRRPSIEGFALDEYKDVHEGSHEGSEASSPPRAESAAAPVKPNMLVRAQVERLGVLLHATTPLGWPHAPDTASDTGSAGALLVASIAAIEARAVLEPGAQDMRLTIGGIHALARAESGAGGASSGGSEARVLLRTMPCARSALSAALSAAEAPPTTGGWIPSNAGGAAAGVSSGALTTAARVLDEFRAAGPIDAAEARHRPKQTVLRNLGVGSHEVACGGGGDLTAAECLGMQMLALRLRSLKPKAAPAVAAGGAQGSAARTMPEYAVNVHTMPEYALSLACALKPVQLNVHVRELATIGAAFARFGAAVAAHAPPPAEASAVAPEPAAAAAAATGGTKPAAAAGDPTDVLRTLPLVALCLCLELPVIVVPRPSDPRGGLVVRLGQLQACTDLTTLLDLGPGARPKLTNLDEPGARPKLTNLDEPGARPKLTNLDEPGARPKLTNPTRPKLTNLGWCDRLRLRLKHVEVLIDDRLNERWRVLDNDGEALGGTREQGRIPNDKFTLERFQLDLVLERTLPPSGSVLPIVLRVHVRLGALHLNLDSLRLPLMIHS